MTKKFKQKFTIGNIFKTVRLINALTQKDLSRAIKISQPYLSKIEQDMLAPNIDTVINLAKKFDISLDSFKLGYIPGLVEGRGLYRLLPLKYREKGKIKLQSILLLLSEIEDLLGCEEVEGFLGKNKIKIEVFPLVDIRVNDSLIEEVFSSLKGVLDRDQVKFLESVTYSNGIKE